MNRLNGVGMALLAAVLVHSACLSHGNPLAGLLSTGTPRPGLSGLPIPDPSPAQRPPRRTGVSGAKIRMHAIYSQYVTDSTGRTNATGFSDYPCANVLHSYALKGLAKSTTDNHCAVLPAKALSDSQRGEPCFAELWISIDKLSKSVNAEDGEVLFELRRNKTNEAVGAMTVNFTAARANGKPWLSIDITHTFNLFTRRSLAEPRPSVRLCVVSATSLDRLSVEQRALDSDQQVRPKPFIVAGHTSQRLRGLDDFMREKRTAVRRRRQSNPLSQILQERGDPTPSMRPLSTPNDQPASRPCRRIPLNVSFASILNLDSDEELIHPQFIDLHDCVGHCTADSEPSSVHALLMREVRKQRPPAQRPDEASTGCCVPVSFADEPIAIFLSNKQGELSLYSDIRSPTVTACGCS